MQWLSEKAASELLQRKPETIRKNVTKGVWDVRYSAINGRKYMYSKADLDKLIERHSCKVKSFS